MWLLALVYAPFAINDLLFRLADSATQWLLIDYAVRIVVLLLIVAVPSLWRLASGGNEPVIAVWKLVIATMVVGVVTVVVEVFALRYFAGPVVTPNTAALGNYRQSILLVFDLTAGIYLVALSEEIVGRRIAARVLRGFTSSSTAVVLISALLFGLVHWGSGWFVVAMATIGGILLMILYLYTRRLWPVVTVHCVFDVLIFSGLMRSFV